MNPPIKKVGLILKRNDSRLAGIVADVVPWLRSRGIDVFMDQVSAERYPATEHVTTPEELASHVDVVTVFGGDGTFLYASRMVAAVGVPIMGVNLGSLGFLTEVTLEGLHSAFEGLIAGTYKVEERALLEVEVLREGRVLARYLALNDAVINKGALARIIEIEVTVNAQLVTLTRADGLIISTPTGSTAYSLSAGGPIVHPTLEAFIITPICPHTLTNRPVVVPDRAVLEVVLRRGSGVMLTVDGQVGMPIVQQDSLRVRKAAVAVRIVQPAGSTFFKLLREKLKWG
jgi:NAD+ kinase